MRLPTQFLINLMDLGNVSIKEFAEAAGIEERTFRRLLKGESPLRAKHIRRIAQVLGIHEADFFELISIVNPVDKKPRPAILSGAMTQMSQVSGLVPGSPAAGNAVHKERNHNMLADILGKVKEVILLPVPLGLVIVGALVIHFI